MIRLSRLQMEGTHMIACNLVNNGGCKRSLDVAYKQFYYEAGVFPRYI